MRTSPVAGKYEKYVDNESAYEMLEKQAIEDEKLAELERQRAELEAEKEKFAKEKEKAAADAAKKAEKEAAKKQAAKEKAAERRKNKIESQLISTGGSLLRRGLMSILKKK